MGFTDKQKAFINHYIVHLNATKAAQLAGYSEKTAYSIGHENLRKPEISAEIEKRLRENAMRADEVLSRLSDMARGDMGEYLLKAPEDLADHDYSRLIKKYKRTTRYSRKTDEEIETVEIELYSAQQALETLAKVYKLTTSIQVEDWQSQAIADIKAGNIAYDALAQAFDHDLATELFTKAGVPVSSE